MWNVFSRWRSCAVPHCQNYCQHPAFIFAEHGPVEAEAPSQVPHVMGCRTSLQRTGTLPRARRRARAPANRLQPRQGGRAARRLAELMGCRSRQTERETWRKRTARLCGYRVRWCLWKVETNPSLNKRRQNGLGLSTGPCQATWQHPPEFSWSPVQKPSPGRNDCGPGDRRGTNCSSV
jgi:hypothetical protein